MSLFRREKWEPVFSCEDEAEARIVLGFLEGHEFKVKLLGDPAAPYQRQPAIRGMAGRWGKYLILVPEKDVERAENLISDYLEEGSKGG